MEPMTLGSPVGSPASPPTSPFLPAFLMGEPATTPGSISLAKSPALSGKQLHFGTPIAQSTNQEMRSIRPTSAVLHAAEKGSGPPTRGLYDPEEIYQPIQSPGLVMSRFEGTYIQNITPVPAFSVSTPMHSDGHWVTVFGFPPSAASHILSQFAQYGTVLASKSSPRGNWVHIKYQSAIEARKALSNNGKVFGGSFMVGVAPCSDLEIVSEHQDKENRSVDDPDGFFSPSPAFQRANVDAYRGVNLSTPMRASNVLGSPLTPRMSTARPLAQAYRAAQHPSEVIYSHTAPQRSTSLVGKAMEYFFGW